METVKGDEAARDLNRMIRRFLQRFVSLRRVHYICVSYICDVVGLTFCTSSPLPE